MYQNKKRLEKNRREQLRDLAHNNGEVIVPKVSIKSVSLNEKCDTEKPTLDYVFVELNSKNLELFYQRLHADVPWLLKNLICTRCWAIVLANRRNRHKFHDKYLISGLKVSSPELFMETAKKYGMICNNQVAVI
jgi:hypothetical protein